MYTSFLEKSAYRKNLKKTSEDLCDFLNQNEKILVYNGNKFTSNHVQQYIIQKKDHIHDNIIKPILLDAAIRSESIAGGSGDICLKMCSLMLDDFFKRKKPSIPKDIEKIICKISKKLSKNDYEKLIEKNQLNDNQKDIFLKLIEFAHVATPIFVEKTASTKTSIKIDKGYTFNVSIDKEYITNKKMKDVSCYVIDGFIETVGEIHHLLEKAASDKKPYVIFIRNLSEDVKSTIQFNIKRGSINLIPISVGFEMNTLNILNDISICTGSDLISSLKGDLISRSVQRDATVIDSIELEENSITIINKKSNNSVKNHLRYLRKRKDKTGDIALIDIFDKRIKSMSSGKIKILIGTEMMSEDPQTVEKFDNILRQFRSLIQSGVVYKEEICEISKYIEQTVKSEYPYSSLSIIIAIKNAISTTNSLKNISGAIYKDID